MDSVALELFAGLTLDLEGIDPEISKSTFRRYLRVNLRSMVNIVFCTLFQDRIGEELHEQFSPRGVEVIRKHVRIICDHLVSLCSSVREQTNRGTELRIQSFILRLRWTIENQYRDNRDPIPTEATALIYLTRRFAYVVGFAHDTLQEEARQINSTLQFLEMYARRSPSGINLDYIEADPTNALCTHIEEYQSRLYGDRLSLTGDIIQSRTQVARRTLPFPEKGHEEEIIHTDSDEEMEQVEGEMGYGLEEPQQDRETDGDIAGKYNVHPMIGDPKLIP